MFATGPRGSVTPALAALAAATALTLAGCPLGVGAACDDASDCRAELYCDPITNTCQKNGTNSDGATPDATPGTDAANTDAANTDAAPGTDATPGTDGSMGTDSALPGTDAAPGSVTFCTSAGGCAAGETCQTSFCSMPADSEGFCTETGRPVCGGFGGTPCPAGPYPDCLNIADCMAADFFGICVTPEERMMICAMQPALWSCP